MADTPILTFDFRQTSVGQLQVTPTGGHQQSLADALASAGQGGGGGVTSFSGRTGAINLQAADVSAALGPALLTAPLSYPQLPVEVQNLPVPYYHFGAMGGSETCLMFVINQPLLLPAAMAGTQFLTFDFATADTVFQPAVYQAGAWTALGALTVASNGTLTMPASPAVTLQIGDAFRLVGPAQPDAKLRDFSFCFMFERV